MSRGRQLSLTEEQQQEIGRLRGTGMSWPAIGAQLGIPETTARRYGTKNPWSGPPPEVTFAPLPCQRCGVTFTPATGNAKYCEDCRPIAAREQNTERARQKRKALRPGLGELEHRHPVGPEEYQTARWALGLGSITELNAIGDDPFYCGTDRHVALAKWFAGLWQRSGVARAHLRRIHYWAMSVGSARFDGRPYENTEACWAELGFAAKYARYLGLVDPEHFEDRRNSEAVIYCPGGAGDDEWTGAFYNSGSLTLPPPDDGAQWHPGSGPGAFGYDYYPGEQPLTEVWIEKSTMNDVLLPVCSALGINLVAGSGHESITALIAFLRRAQAHGRAAHVLYISDFDPAGDSMPRAVARQAQFWAERLGIDVEVTVEVAGLTGHQVASYGLPTVPIKDTDRRAAGFEAKHGVDGAVELDALEALHPGQLARIVRGAASKWPDETLQGRLREAEREADRIVREWWDDEDNGDAYELTGELGGLADEAEAFEERYRETMAELAEEARALTDRLRELDGQAEELLEAADLDLPGRPEATEPEVDREALLYDSRRSWLEQLPYWQRHRDGAQ